MKPKVFKRDVSLFHIDLGKWTPAHTGVLHKSDVAAMPQDVRARAFN